MVPAPGTAKQGQHESLTGNGVRSLADRAAPPRRVVLVAVTSTRRPSAGWAGDHAADRAEQRDRAEAGYDATTPHRRDQDRRRRCRAGGACGLLRVLSVFAARRRWRCRPRRDQGRRGSPSDELMTPRPRSTTQNMPFQGVQSVTHARRPGGEDEEIVMTWCRCGVCRTALLPSCETDQHRRQPAR